MTDAPKGAGLIAHHGLISGTELLTDVRLDGRPLGEILVDPQRSSSRAGARRVGALARLVQGALG